MQGGEAPLTARRRIEDLFYIIEDRVIVGGERLIPQLYIGLCFAKFVILTNCLGTQTNLGG
ncbi:hypothetical protein O5D80_002558 [Batrachochytrium dendrobatidis]|nr:hypothetical protein O5D80_002558 [Batrachochytrium dendrobatidis]